MDILYQKLFTSLANEKDSPILVNKSCEYFVLETFYDATLPNKLSKIFYSEKYLQCCQIVLKNFFSVQKRWILSRKNVQKMTENIKLHRTQVPKPCEKNVFFTCFLTYLSTKNVSKKMRYIKIILRTSASVDRHKDPGFTSELPQRTSHHLKLSKIYGLTVKFDWKDNESYAPFICKLVNQSG